MNLYTLSVRRGVTFAMIYLIVALFGLFSLSRLQLDLFPDIQFPTVAVVTTYTGASPEDMETLVTRPIEGAMAGVKRVEEVRSESGQGTSMVLADFDWSADMEQAETDVRRQLELVEGFLPDEASAPIVFAMDPALQPVVVLSVGGPYPLDQLRSIAEDQVQPRLERLDGVATAEVSGGLDRQIRVVVDPVRLEAHGLDPTAIAMAIAQENLQEPGGTVEQGPLEYTIHVQGRYGSVDEIAEVVVGMGQTTSGPVPIRLGQVAEVVDGFAESERVLEVDGEPAVLIQVRKQSGENTVRTADRVMEVLPGIERDAGVNVQVVSDQAAFVNRSLSNLSSTALVGVLISFVVVLLFLRNWRSALIVSSAIPLSVLATFGLMDQAGMTLNIISMAGLALAIGMLVDNAIVVLENIFRLRQEGLGPWEAAIEGARTVGTAVIASTLTTVSVFVPVLFVTGIAGVMFQDMAVTICFALAVSLVVALTFIPMASSRLLGGGAPSAPGRLFESFKGLYGRMLDWTLSHRWVIGLGLVGVLALAGIGATRMATDFMPGADQSAVELSLEAPVGASLEETTRLMRSALVVVEEEVSPAERELVSLDVGQGDGVAAVFAGVGNTGSIHVSLVPQAERERTQRELEDALRVALRAVPGVEATVTQHGPTGSTSDVDVLLRGHALDAAREAGVELQEQLLALPEVAEVSFSLADQKPEVRVAFDRTRIAHLGLSTATASRTLSSSFMGRSAGRYAEGGEEHDIVVRYPADERADVDAVGRLPLTTPTGEVVALSNVADVEVGLGPASISRSDQERIVTLGLTLHDSWTDDQGRQHRKDLGRTITRVEEVVDATSLPEGLSSEVGGSAEDFAESFRSLGLALLVSIALVYMVMASQFESLRQPLIILCTVPLALVGVVGLFAVTGLALDVTALIGVIMLVGIAVNNGIVMVDAANQLRATGLDRVAAIATASRLRLRPVLLTSLTTILSMVPLALEIGEGAAQWSGMARAVIGGLIAATALTLFVVPVAYTLFAEKDVEVAA